MSEYGLIAPEALAALTQSVASLGGVRAGALARSILGRDIPVFTLGQGKKAVVVVGAHGGTESLASAVLFDFIKDYSAQYEKNAKVFDINLSYLFAERRIIMVPMLNPDGVSYALSGIGRENPLRERVLQMNGSEDLSAWQANARGVDLSHNYSVGFAAHKREEQQAGLLNGAAAGFGGEYPESEPETAALCRFLRFIGEDVLGVLDLRLGEAGISCSCRDKLSAKTMAAGRILGRAMGHRDPTPTMVAPTGGLADWCIEKLSRPAYRLTVKAPSHPHPKARAILLESLRHALYTFPFML